MDQLIRNFSSVIWTPEKAILAIVMILIIAIIPVAIILDVIRAHYRHIKKYAIADRLAVAMLVLSITEAVLMFGSMIYILCF